MRSQRQRSLLLLTIGDVAVTNDDRPTLATLPVQLIDKVFSGQATASSIVVASGSVTHSGAEGVSVVN